MHHARTQAESIALRLRAYSHRWLVERGLPTGLPDRLRPSAEQICPITVGAVGISVNTKNEWLQPAVLEVRTAMEHAVEDAYAEGRRDPVFVSAQIEAARRKTWQALFGGLGRGSC